ncbi:hypothetical protein ES708_34348 [subsurface metagenome]
MGEITGDTVKAFWYNPRNGVTELIGEFPNSGAREFNPPGEPKRENDWVLILDDSSKNYPAP